MLLKSLDQATHQTTSPSGLKDVGTQEQGQSTRYIEQGHAGDPRYEQKDMERVLHTQRSSREEGQ